MPRNSSVRAITTRYKGYAFRSRLEARWAVFFDHLKIRWEYEPEGFELGNGLRYLPDFWLPDWRLWVEIKPDAPDAAAREKASRLVMQTGHPLYMTHGMPDRVGTLFIGRTRGGEDPGCPGIPARPSWFVLSKGRLPFFVNIDDCAGYVSNDQEGTVWSSNCGPTCSGTTASVPTAALDAARSARFEYGQKGAV